jgi:dTDP-4-amino-4,6-dideoxygalactose transaminase
VIVWPGPRESYLAHAAEIDDGIRRVIESGWYVLGTEVAAFEREFAFYVGAAGAAGVASGTDGLVIALRAVGVRPGDRVITVSHTAVATVAAIELAGAVPVLADVDSADMTMGVDSLERTIAATGRPAAVVPVHLYGQPADMPAIVEIARDHGAAVVEDCSQAHGAVVGGRQVGTWGDAAAFSCYPTKNLGALGDAGVVVGDDGVIETVRLLRQYGWRERYISELAGFNSRLDPIQAAVLRAKLPSLDAENRRRAEIASCYDAELGNFLTVPKPREGSGHVYHQYVVRTRDRDLLRAALAEDGVPTAVLYPEPVHRQPAYAHRLTTDPAGLPVTDAVCSDLLCLPIHPQLSDKAVDRVCDAVRSWASRR